MTRPSVFARLVALVCALTCTVSPLRAQQTATEYNDKDKKKLAEIAQRPEVIHRIQETWDGRRRQDMEFAFNVNQSSRIGELSLSELATFRQNFGELYNNPVLMRYVNSLGQKIVPQGSPNLYSFRLLLDPVPRAEALSTGTIYISTGLVSMLDSEAQLAYVLGHEIAHVERRHTYNTIRNQILEEEFDREKQSEVGKKRAIFGAVSAIGGAAAGGAIGGYSGALIGAGIGAAGGIAGAFLFRNKFQPTEWSTVYEDEADEAGLKYMLEQNYDAREIPRMYARLDNLVGRDSRVGLGFIGKPERTRERSATITKLITTSYKASLEEKMKKGLTSSGPEFQLLMSALKRDNGVIALDYDLYDEARADLEDAVKLRTNDPRAHYYLGQVMVATGRTQEEKQAAMQEFLQAVQFDAERGAYAEPHLEEALFHLSQSDPSLQEQARKELKTYVALYQRQHAGSLPPNMYIIYDYFLLTGDKGWYVPPAGVVSTRNVESLNVTQGAATRVASAMEVVARATGGSAERSESGSAPAEKAPAKAPVKKASTAAPAAPH
jgi:predicted Zn-dependent protease